MEDSLWVVDLNGKTELTPVEVRNIIVKCFIEAQKETIKRAATKLGRSTSEETIAGSIQTLVKMSFKRVGANYDNPKQSDFTEVVGTLAKKARAMGTPQDIIDHHLKQIDEVINLCPC